MLLFTESYDHCSVAQFTRKYLTASTTGVSLITGRFGNAIRYSTNGGGGHVAVIADSSTVIVGMAWRNGGLARDDNTILAIQEGATNHLLLRHLISQQLRVLHGGGTVLGTSSESLSDNTWYYIEIKVTIGDAGVGSFTVRLNGVPMTNLNAVSADTRNGATGICNRVNFNHPANNGSVTQDRDDVYVCNDVDSGITGAPNNDFLGDIRVQARFPNGNGNSSQLVGSDADSTDNYLLVDEATPDDDTTYVESATPGDKDTYTFEDLAPGTGTVYGVNILPCVRKTDAGSRSIKTISRLSATEEDGPERAVLDNYSYLWDVRNGDPGGGQWTVTDVNGAEFGVKVFS